MEKEFLRSVSWYHNEKTGYTRKQIVLPADLNDKIGKMCKMIWDEEEECLKIYFKLKW